MLTEFNHFFSNYQTILINWFQNHLPKVIFIALAAFVLNKFAKVFIAKVIRQAVRGDSYLSKQAEEKRENTLIEIFTQLFSITILLLASLMILSEFGIDTGPILASAGIVGVAFGFGGQYLIKDLISGLFIILENQYRVGDVLCVADKCGVVESVNIRTTVLRDLDGTLHYVPNGEITVASNLSKDFSQVNMDIAVSYDSDIELVKKTVNQVGQTMIKDKKWQDLLIEAPYFLRIDSFGDSAVKIKILAKTKPMQQWDVAGELRLRLKKAFKKADIEIPFSQQVVHLKK